MKTYKYNTLRGLLRQTDDLNLYGVLSGRLNLRGRGWCRIRFSDSLRAELFAKWAGVIYSRPNDNARNMQYLEPCGILRRLTIDRTGRASYCAGQDYPGEIRYIQGLIRKA